MIRAIALSSIITVAFTPAYAWQFAETPAYSLSLEGYSRADLVTLKNTNSLDSSSKDDSSTYAGIDYSLALHADGRGERPSAYLKVERNGPYDYDAPLWIHNTLMPSGQVPGYHGEELLPGIEEFWVDAPVAQDVGIKAGLFAYRVGHGFAVDGAYENFGVSVYRAADPGFAWCFHYAVPEAVHKNGLGPRLPQEETQEIGHQHSASHLFAVDAARRGAGGFLQGYASALVDRTAPDKRASLFAAPVEEDILGTLGAAGQGSFGAWTLKAEGARNIGKARSASAEYEDIIHAGYLAYGAVEHAFSRWTPSLQMLVCSGNRVQVEAASSGAQTLETGRNRGFSYVSASNTNLGDSISSSNTEMLPIVAMGGGYGLNYGVARPGTFSAGDFENLVMISLGAEYRLSERLTIGLYGYYMRSAEAGVGLVEGEARRLSPELGSECDLFVDYNVRPGVVISLLGGYFIPGAYHTQQRDDSEGSLLSPLVRGDGDADPAFQVELAVELTF